MPMQTLVPAKVASKNVIPALELVEPIKVPGVTVCTGQGCAMPHHSLLCHIASYKSLLSVPCLAPEGL